MFFYFATNILCMTNYLFTNTNSVVLCLRGVEPSLPTNHKLPLGPPKTSYQPYEQRQTITEETEETGSCHRWILPATRSSGVHVKQRGGIVYGPSPERAPIPYAACAPPCLPLSTSHRLLGYQVPRCRAGDRRLRLAPGTTTLHVNSVSQ